MMKKRKKDPMTATLKINQGRFVFFVKTQWDYGVKHLHIV